jgi:iron complex outermembrane receptor protein
MNNTNISRLLSRFMGASALALCIAAPATAQDESNNRMEEIVVTAQKREENVQDVPIAITAITGDTLTAAGVTDISTLEKLAPGLQFGQSGTDARPAIRGARTENVSIQQDPIISFYVDGIYRSLSSQALASIVDVERVEVLRGPQGTLYGRNSFGGAINIISKQPSADTEYGANVTLGDFNRRRFEMYGNLPLSDNLFLRLTGVIDQHDFIIENTFNPDAGLRDKDETYFRAQLRWEPSDTVDFTLRASQWSQGGNGNSDFGYYLLGSPIDPSNDGNGITYNEVLNAAINPVNPRNGGGNSAAGGDPYRIDFDFNPDFDNAQDTVDLEGNFSLSFAELKVMIGYADFSSGRTQDTDYSSFSSGISGQFDEVNATTEEIQLVSNSDGPIRWTAGAYFLQEDKEGLFIFDRFFNTDPVTNTPDGTVATGYFSDFDALATVETTSYAVYGQATYDVSDTFRLTAGVRYTEDEKDFSRVTTGAHTTPATFFEADGVTPRTVFNDSETFDETTWKVAAEFDVSDDSLFYASASTGFQSGGFNNSADAVTGGASFGPQLVDAYELGSKSLLLDGNLRLNVALYRNEFTDLLAQEFVNVGATTLAISTNAGEATATGLEFEADWSAADNLLITARASFTDAEFGDYSVSEPVSGTANNLDGGRIPLTPDVTFGLGAIYDIEMDNGLLSPSGNIYYSGDYSTNDIDYIFGEQDAYTKVDLRLTYFSNNDWFVEAFIDNAGDEEIVNRTVRFGQNMIGQNYSNPRTYGVRFGFNR